MNAGEGKRCIGAECWHALLLGKPTGCAFHNAMLRVLVATQVDDDEPVEQVYPVGGAA